MLNRPAPISRYRCGLTPKHHELGMELPEGDAVAVRARRSYVRTTSRPNSQEKCSRRGKRNIKREPDPEKQPRGPRRLTYERPPRNSDWFIPTSARAALQGMQHPELRFGRSYRPRSDSSTGVAACNAPTIAEQHSRRGWQRRSRSGTRHPSALRSPRRMVTPCGRGASDGGVPFRQSRGTYAQFSV